MIGIAMSIVLFILGITISNQWIGLIDIGLSIIFYILGTYHYRWMQTMEAINKDKERNK